MQGVCGPFGCSGLGCGTSIAHNVVYNTPAYSFSMNRTSAITGVFHPWACSSAGLSLVACSSPVVACSSSMVACSKSASSSCSTYTRKIVSFRSGHFSRRQHPVSAGQRNEHHGTTNPMLLWTTTHQNAKATGRTDPPMRRAPV